MTVPFDHEAFDEIHTEVTDHSTLKIEFDVAPFHEGWSGHIECRFSTPLATQMRGQVEARRAPS